jgi:hypothetical protein
MTYALDLLSSYTLSKSMKIKIYRKSNFACFIWEWNLFSTLREITEWGCLENRVLRGIFGPKREEVIGCCRKLYAEELHDLYCWPDIIRVIKARGKDAVQGAQGLAGRCVRSRIQWMKDKWFLICTNLLTSAVWSVFKNICACSNYRFTHNEWKIIRNGFQ